jgi:cardiolipin synthase
MNVPNLLSLFRLFVTFFFILAVCYNRLDIALYLFIIQGASDLLDGFIARVMRKKTNLGAFLDPIADKTMLIAGFIMLSIKHTPGNIPFIPLWLTTLVLLRDIVIATGFLLLYKFAYTIKPVPTILGKITTVCQLATILYILFVWPNVGTYSTKFFLATAFFIFVSGCHYVFVGIRLLRSPRVSQSPAGS